MVADSVISTLIFAVPAPVGGLLAMADFTVKPLAAAVAVVSAAIAGGLLTWVVYRSLRSGTIRQARIEA